MASCPKLSRRCKCLSIVVLAIYVLFSGYSAYMLYKSHSADSFVSVSRGNDELKSRMYGNRPGEETKVHKSEVKIPSIKQITGQESSPKRPVVEIWGKAAIGLYLWEHIMGGTLSVRDDGLLKYGDMVLDGIEFRFRTGPGLIFGRVPLDVEFLVLVLNGREEAKVNFSKNWLNYLQLLPRLRRVAVVLLGNEKCQNDWILPYMAHQGGKVKVAFITYDSSLVDNYYFYQWPLGVSTYRNFPYLSRAQVDLHSDRVQLCNFIGTVYQGSSREILHSLLTKDKKFNCFIQTRKEWQSSETEESLLQYVTTMLDSDLTLSPVGVNTECYRIYEALSCGSIPVVEDVMTEGYCGGLNRVPLRLLKLYNAPLVYISDWEKELPQVLDNHRKMSATQKVAFRRKILDWYQNFTLTMKSQFVSIIKTKLLLESSYV